MGAPDLVAEIVSPSIGIRDRREKFALYERYGIREYWIIDPVEKLVEIYRHNDESFVRIGVFAPDDTPGTPLLPGFQLDLSLCFP